MEVACNASNKEVAMVLKERGARVRRVREVLEGCFLRRDAGIIGVLMSEKRDVKILMERKNEMVGDHAEEYAM